MANSDKNISSAVIKRLPRYFRYLGALKAKNITRISSKELSEQMMVTASQIRQDLNNFGGFGQQGYGYNVDNLYTEIGKILGLDKRNDMIIVGAGNLGQALANYQSFNEDYGYKVMALFDVNPKLIGISVRGVKVLDTDELENFIKTHGIKIAALTIPKDQAPAIAKKMAEWGIKGFWNFAPIDLHLPDNVTVENVHLAESLMTLTYNVHNREAGKKMIAGIGTDLVEIYRIEEMILRGRHLSRIFTTTELAYAKDNATTLAGNFAVKEAVSKVFGTGFFGVEPYEIEVLRNESGAPYVKLYGNAKEIAKDKQVSRIHVSITNTREFAQAFAIGECV